MYLLHSLFFSQHPDVFVNKTDEEDFHRFVTKLANLTYFNFEELPMNKTFNIKSKDYMQLLWNLSFPFRSEVTSGTTKQLHLQETITELGICYTVNSRIAEYNSYKLILVKPNGE